MPSAVIQSIDGTGNNLDHPEWGSVGVAYLRTASAAYSDGISSPAGSDRPSARAVSNALAAQGPASIENDRELSAFVYAWGQFLDHDLDLTDSADPAELFSIQVPIGDPSFDPASTGTKTIPLTRSAYDPATGDSASNPRQQVNSITAFIDGSQVYGSDATRAAALRTFSGGLLKTSGDNLLPVNDVGLPNANAGPTPDDDLFLAGDVRANENIELTAIHTLFLREHNRLATRFAADHPDWTDEQLYQEARKLVIAQIQSITYNEFLPALLGKASLGPYRGYNPQINPGITNEFATAAYRFGHSMVGDDVQFLDNHGQQTRDTVAMSQAFFNPDLLRETGIDPIIKYLASDNSQEIDLKIVDSLRDFLFGPPGAGGLDLAALNIQRGRDHGLADYNTTRAAYGLPAVTAFDQITSDTAVQQALASLYGSVDKIDLWVGILAEDHLPGASVGPTARRIIANQFRRLRDGDSFWHERTLNEQQLQFVRSSRLSDVVRRNTGLTNLQGDVFVFRTEIKGQVFADLNANAQRDQGENGVPRYRLELVNEEGEVVQTRETDPAGRFYFDDVGLGAFQVRLAPRNGWRASGQPARPIAFTKGQVIEGLNFSVVPPAGTTPGDQTQPPPDGRTHRPPPPRVQRTNAGTTGGTTNAGGTTGTQPPPPRPGTGTGTGGSTGTTGIQPPPPPQPGTGGSTGISGSTGTQPPPPPPPPPGGQPGTNTGSTTGRLTGLRRVNSFVLTPVLDIRDVPVLQG